MLAETIHNQNPPGDKLYLVPESKMAANSKWLPNMDIKYDLNLKNQARVFKFETMDAIDTRIKNIEKKIFRS